MRKCRQFLLLPSAIAIGLAVVPHAAGAGEPAGAVRPLDADWASSGTHRLGRLGTVSTNGFNSGPTRSFFTALGTNGRTCATCHAADQGYSLSPAGVNAVARLDFRDPLFDPVDGGSDCPPTSGQQADARRSGMLRRYALIREQIAAPAGADFSLLHASNPQHCRIAPASPPIGGKLILFRRPLPTTNLHFLSDVRWDGRATVEPIITGVNGGDIGPLVSNLAAQANTASIGHELSAPILGTQALTDMVAFERNLFSAQIGLGPLASLGYRSGPRFLAFSVAPGFFIGQNDPLKDGFTPNVFTLFTDWERDSRGQDPDANGDRLRALRHAIGQGEKIFNSRRFVIANVPGLNSATTDPLFNAADPFAGRKIVATCSFCHNTPNVGNHSSSLMLDTGVGRARPRDNRGQPLRLALDIASLPVYALRSSSGSIVQVTDPGRGLISGKWLDIGKVKVPILRGLAAHPPYFHNGSAKDLMALVKYYDSRFNIGLDATERRSLAAFLSSL